MAGFSGSWNPSAGTTHRLRSNSSHGHLVRRASGRALARMNGLTLPDGFRRMRDTTQALLLAVQLNASVPLSLQNGIERHAVGVTRIGDVHAAIVQFADEESWMGDRILVSADLSDDKIVILASKKRADSVFLHPFGFGRASQRFNDRQMLPDFPLPRGSRSLKSMSWH